MNTALTLKRRDLHSEPGEFTEAALGLAKVVVPTNKEDRRRTAALGKVANTLNAATDLDAMTTGLSANPLRESENRLLLLTLSCLDS